MHTTLIEPNELATALAAALDARTADPDWVVVDCRFDLARPGWGAEAYALGHVPGALYANLDRDSSSAVTPDSGRHPLPTREMFLATLGRWGIDAKVQVVCYDQGNSAFASRLWWLMRWAGHAAVAVLNGGFAAWQQAGLQVSQQPGGRQPRDFTPSHASPGIVTTAELAQIVAAGQLANGERSLVDARGADRFAGQNETLDPVAGHVPGALNRPFSQNLDSTGRFLPPDTLRAQWVETLRGRSPPDAIAMCGSGVTACQNLLALEVAGLSGARLYAGSWSEWIRDASRPVER